jgi:hypothetical protein
MCGTTPPCEMMTEPRSLFNLSRLNEYHMLEKASCRLLFIILDGQLKVSRNDTRLFVVTRSVSGELEDFGSQILEHCSKVNRSTSANTLSVVSFLQKTVNAANGELH